MTTRIARVTILSLLAAAMMRPTDGGPPQRPHVVIILIDDLGWGDLSCFGGPTRTMHIDRLAAEGIRFRRFYVNAPICSPSRVALATGQYPQRWRITSYLDHRHLNESRGMAQWLDPAAPMLARRLRETGYATGHFGKWHMGGQRDVGDAPLITAYGFDHSLTNFEGLGPRVLPLCDAYDGTPPRRHDLGSAALGHGPIRWEERSQVTAAFVAAATAFLDRGVRDGRPCFVHLWPDDVHSPYCPPAGTADGGGKRDRYRAVLTALDHQLGVLFDHVRDTPALRDNTLILLCSDNGHEEGAGSAGPLRGGKTWLYEGGVRSPLIVWGPGVISPSAAGRSDDASVFCSVDVNRSLYPITNTPLPPHACLDGFDVSPALTGHGPARRSEPIFWRRPPDRPGTESRDNPDLAACDGRWKYYVNFDGGDPQLYDLENDESEVENIVAVHPDIAARLNREIARWNASLPGDAGMPAR